MAKCRRLFFPLGVETGRQRLKKEGSVLLSGFDHPRSHQLVAVVPCRELPRGDTPLGGVEEQIDAASAHEEPRLLQRLAVADADPEPAAFARRHRPGGIDPVHIAGSDVQRGAPQTGCLLYTSDAADE